jgi:alpha,alpha-trehalase
MAGTVDILQRGYPEIVTREDVLRLNPRLPRDLQKLCLKIRYRGYFLSFEISKDRLKVATLNAQAHPIKIGCGEAVVELKGGESWEVKLK